jgi:hypothetical protein
VCGYSIHELVRAKDSAAAAFHRRVSKDVQINCVEMTAKIGQNDWLINDIPRKVAKSPFSICQIVGF